MTLTAVKKDGEMKNNDMYNEWENVFVLRHVLIKEGKLILNHPSGIKEVFYSETQLRSIVDEVLRRASEGALMTFHCGTFKHNQPTQYHQSGADNLQIDKQSILQTKYDDLL